MRNASILGLALVLAAAASAQAPQSAAERRANREQQMRLVERAFELRPRRRDTPLRELNISDNEVREIQVVAAKYVPKVLLNISPVVAGCPCEEGPQCTEQVFIVAEKPQSSVGLQLSRVKNAWQLGVVQEWWLRFDALTADRNKMDYQKYLSVLNELYRDFPMCVGELVPAENTTASTPKVESRK